MDKAKLLAKRGPSWRDVEVDVGTVRVRGLTRAEVTACGEGEDQEVQIIATAMVDPELTPDEVALWFADAPAGDYVAVMTAVSELSGLGEGAKKSGVPKVRGRARR